MLGAEIVADPVGCPAQRFHPECWQSLCGPTGERVERPAAPRRIGTIEETEDCAAGGAGAAGAAERGDGDIVTGYADAWRREGMQDHRGSRAYRSSRPALPRSTVLEGLISYEDGTTGEKKIARGFSSGEVETVTARWAAGTSKASACCEADAAEECAICFSAASRGPLRLPCGHCFCGECVVPWLKKCALCPMCRADLRPMLDRETPRSALPGPATPQTSRRSRSGSVRPEKLVPLVPRGGGSLRGRAEAHGIPVRGRSLSVTPGGGWSCSGNAGGSRKASKETAASSGA